MRRPLRLFRALSPSKEVSWPRPSISQGTRATVYGTDYDARMDQDAFENDQDAPEATADDTTETAELIEEISIDGMCGVY